MYGAPEETIILFAAYADVSLEVLAAVTYEHLVVSKLIVHAMFNRCSPVHWDNHS
jgi:hypothetical protein